MKKLYAKIALAVIGWGMLGAACVMTLAPSPAKGAPGAWVPFMTPARPVPFMMPARPATAPHAPVEQRPANKAPPEQSAPRAPAQQAPASAPQPRKVEYRCRWSFGCMA